MLRRILLFLSKQERLRQMMVTNPTARKAARRFVAGETVEDSVEVVRKANAIGMKASLNYLGESVSNVEEANRVTEAYISILDRIQEARITCNISVKPTHLGLDLGEIVFMGNVKRVLDRARSYNSFVRVEMEGSAYTDRTIELFKQLLRDGYDNAGIVLQAYLFRTEKDIEDLIPMRARIRLCKGAYREPSRKIAYQNKMDIRRTYIRLAKRLLDADVQPALATHDPKVIWHMADYAKGRDISADRYQFQMLYGIRRDLQERLAKEGYNFLTYVPFGQNWYPYLMRRLAERPANVVFLLRSVIREAVHI